MAAPSTDVSLRLRPPEALNQRPVEASEDFREYIKEVPSALAVRQDGVRPLSPARTLECVTQHYAIPASVRMLTTRPVPASMQLQQVRRVLRSLMPRR